MKTRTLIKTIKSLGLTVDEYETYIVVKNYYIDVASVSRNRMFQFNTDYTSFGNLNESTKGKLFKCLLKYARTPIEYRENENDKYFLRFSYISGIFTYLNEYRNDYENLYVFSDKTECNDVKTKFTEIEIEELPVWVKNMIEQGHIVKELAAD